LKSISKISVKLNLQGQVHDVGNLVLDADGKIYFKYDDIFISPEKSELFLEELKKINPHIEII
jgi:hypothetical protein